jgi:cation transport protein ChaC
MADDIWVFGYGSLIWDPGFAFAESTVARLDGWHRSFCMLSVHYRGTPAAPGLVLALDRAAGASCHGVAFRVPAAEAMQTTAYLRARELISDAYLEARLPVALPDGRQVEALTYVINRDHAQYAGILTPDQQAAIIATSAGANGDNAAYLHATAAHLAALGIADAEMEHLVALVTQLRA